MFYSHLIIVLKIESNVGYWLTRHNCILYMIINKLLSPFQYVCLQLQTLDFGQYWVKLIVVFDIIDVNKQCSFVINDVIIHILVISRHPLFDLLVFLIILINLFVNLYVLINDTWFSKLSTYPLNFLTKTTIYFCILI